MKLTIKPVKNLSKKLQDSITAAREACARLLTELESNAKQLAELRKFQEGENANISLIKSESEGAGVKALTAKRKLLELEGNAKQTAAAIEQTEGILEDQIAGLQHSARELKDLFWATFGAPARAALMEKRIEAVRPFFAPSDQNGIIGAAAFYRIETTADIKLTQFFSPVLLGSSEPEALATCVREMLERFDSITEENAPVYWDSSASLVE